MKRIAALLLALALLFSVAACGKKTTCPMCSAKADFSAQVYCSNCGYDFGSMKPDGYWEDVQNSAPDTSSAEKSGVPEAQVHADLLYEGIYLNDIADDVTYKISHDVNLDTHTDIAAVTMNMVYSFGVKTYVLTMQYQYYKSDDLWELIGYDEVSCHFEANPNSYLGYWSITDHDSFNIDKWEFVLRIYEFDGMYADVELLKYTEDDIEYVYEGSVELQLKEYSDNSYYVFNDGSFWCFDLDIGGVKYNAYRYMEFSPF